jgi:type VI secretion system protein ImpA
LLNGLVETFWGDLYPRLDPADGNDPTERVNIVASLAAPVGTFGDPMKVLERLREAPLTQSVQMGRFSFADLLRSEGGTPGPDEKPPPSADQIKAAFRDTGSDELTQLAQVLSASAALVDQLDERLTSAVGADKAADLSPLKREFLDIQKRLAPYLPEGTVAVEEGAGEAGAPAEPGAAPKAITGEIQSRQDVIRMLQKICDYYSRHEPSSPVPYLLKRAERLAEKNFMEIINDMSPEALEQITRITGAESAAEAPPPAEGGG